MAIQIPGYQPMAAPLDLNIGQQFAVAQVANQKQSPFSAALQRGYELGYKNASDQDMFQQELQQKQPLVDAQAQQALAHRDKFLSDIGLDKARANMDLNKGYLDLQKGSLEINKAQEEANNAKMVALLPHLMNKSPEELAQASNLAHHVFSQLNPAYAAVVDTNKALTHNDLKTVQDSLLPLKDRLTLSSPEKLGKLSQLQALYDQNSANYERALASGNTKGAYIYRQRMQQTQQDIQKEITPREGQKIEINTQDSVTNSVRKKLGETFGQELAKEKIDVDRRANTMLSAIQVFRNSMGNTIQTDVLGDKRLKAEKLVNSVASLFGVKYKADKIANSEVLVAKAADMTLSESKKYGPLGSMSDSDREFFRTLVASNVNTPLANKIILNAAESDILANQDALAFKLAYLEKNGTLNGFDSQLKRYKEDLPKIDVGNNFAVIEDNLGKYTPYLDPNYKGIQYSGMDKSGNLQDIPMSEIRKTAKELKVPIEKVIADLKLSPKT